MRTPTAWPGKGLPCSLQPVLTSRLLPRHSGTWQSGRPRGLLSMASSPLSLTLVCLLQTQSGGHWAEMSSLPWWPLMCPLFPLGVAPWGCPPLSFSR